MNVGIMIIAHELVGEALLKTAISTLGHTPHHIVTLPVTSDTDQAQLRHQAEELLAHLDSDTGTLVLTDIYGSTPSNIACDLEAHHNIRVVAGLNLPMLIRVLNYADLGLDELTEKALSGGRDGVLAACAPQNR